MSNHGQHGIRKKYKKLIKEEKMKKDIEELGAILQRDKETYAIVPNTPAGMLSAEAMETVAAVVRRYDIPIVKITSGQRLALVGLKEEDLQAVWNDLGMAKGQATALCLHYVQACPGTSVCRFGMRDSLGFATEIEEIYRNLHFPAKLKFGVSGCPMCCAESYLRDIGIFGKKKGWTVVVGGNAGGRPRIGDVLAVDLDREACHKLVEKVLAFYRDNARKKERMARFVARVGIEAVREAVL